MQIIASGINVPAIECIIALFIVISGSKCLYCAGSIEFIPNNIGVPAAPNVTAVLFATSATIIAASAGNPSETSNGAASAAGVPNPAAPSMKLPNIHAIIIACILLSVDMFDNILFIVMIAPLFWIMLSKSNAPNIMNIMSSAITAPFIDDASIVVLLTCHAVIAIVVVIIQTAGIVLFAGKCNTAIKINIKRIGVNASISNSIFCLFLIC